MSPEIALILRALVLFAVVLLIERGLRRRAARRRAELPLEWQRALDRTYGKRHD